MERYTVTTLCGTRLLVLFDGPVEDEVIHILTDCCGSLEVEVDDRSTVRCFDCKQEVPFVHAFGGFDAVVKANKLHNCPIPRECALTALWEIDSLREKEVASASL